MKLSSIKIHLKILSLLLAAAIFIIGKIYADPTWSGICADIDSARPACSIPSMEMGLSLEELGKALLLVALVVLFANARGLKRWMKFSLFFLPIAAVCVYAMANTILLFDKIGYQTPIDDFGFSLYLPLTFLIATLSYIPKRKRDVVPK